MVSSGRQVLRRQSSSLQRANRRKTLGVQMQVGQVVSIILAECQDADLLDVDSEGARLVARFSGPISRPLPMLGAVATGVPTGNRGGGAGDASEEPATPATLKAEPLPRGSAPADGDDGRSRGARTEKGQLA
eukprot:11398475-Alexandrium_andersonii.AAC.1